MTSTTAGASRAQISAGKVLMRLSQALIALAVIYWLGRNLVDSPAEFFSVGVTGLSNGALYALIALGYTLVYGIIELINFAHGDLFMLGAVFSYFVLTKALKAEGASSRNWALLALTLVLVMAFCA